MMKFTIVCLLIITISVIAAQECTEGQTKKVDCNTCRCANGIWACTRRGCIRKREAEQCKDGETMPLDCNTCWCSLGKWLCTQIGCLSSQPALDANDQPARVKREVPGADVLAITPCAPNDYFQLDCNVCYCKTDRTGYLCTDNNCSDEAWALSTTTHIPLSNDSMLIMSNYGIELIENLNSNDNSISRIPKSLKSSTLSHETVDPEIVNLETVESKTDESKTVKTVDVADVTVDSETTQPESVQLETVQLETVKSEIVESQTAESETVLPESAEFEPKHAERKNSPRNPLIIADEQRRLASLRNQ